MNVLTSTRNLVYQRDSFRCVHCGVTKGLVLRPRKINSSLATPERLVVMCLTDFERIDTDQHFSDLAMNHGWKLRTWEQPENREVYYQADSEWFYLTERGTRIRAGETADGG